MMRDYAQAPQRLQRTNSATRPARPHIHRATGNQAIQRLLEANGQPAAAAPTPAVGPTPQQGTEREPTSDPATRKPLSSLSIQSKLAVGATDDPLELEADRMAETVLQTNGTTTAAATDEHLRPRLRNDAGASPATAPKNAGGRGAFSESELESGIRDLRGRGKPLASPTRAFLEPRFGADFGHVRVHTNRRASQMAEQLNALAFTTGSEIAFARGQYQPNSTNGRRLLAHELAHVLQQGAGSETQGRSDRARDTTAQHQLSADQVPSAAEGTGQGADPHTLYRQAGDDRSYEQKEIHYWTHEKDESTVEKQETGWGSFVVGDDSYFKDLIGGPTLFRISRSRGVGVLELTEAFHDWRDTAILNEQFFPRIRLARIRWEQHSAEAPLSNVTGTLDYSPDGGGGMQITTLYHYGGYVVDNGLKKGQHNILLNFTYDSSMTKSSGIEFGGEFGGENGKVSVSANSSVSVGMSALSFSREIAFESVSYG